MTEWATISDELSRKSLSVLETYVHKYVVDKTVTAKELIMICDCLYDTVSGLVPFAGCVDIIAHVQKESQKELET